MLGAKANCLPLANHVQETRRLQVKLLKGVTWSHAGGSMYVSDPRDHNHGGTDWCHVRPGAGVIRINESQFSKQTH
ncbi:Hypothetical predicted protein, partial [Pelobates cultripes]